MIAIVLGLARKVPVVVWVIVVSLAWGGWQKLKAERSTKAAAVAEQRAAIEAATAEAERKARALEQDFADRARSAADAYSKQVAQARASADRARAGLDGLRDAIAAAPACPASEAASAPGRTDATTELRGVLGSCAGAIQRLAEAADADATRLTALQQYVQAMQPKDPK